MSATEVITPRWPRARILIHGGLFQLVHEILRARNVPRRFWPTDPVWGETWVRFGQPTETPGVPIETKLEHVAPFMVRKILGYDTCLDDGRGVCVFVQRENAELIGRDRDKDFLGPENPMGLQPFLPWLEWVVETEVMPGVARKMIAEREAAAHA